MRGAAVWLGRGVLASALLCAAQGCDQKSKESANPDDVSKLEAMEPAGDENPTSTAAPAPKPKVVSSVQDRDPEEEKRKMAQSRQRSAQARKMLRSNRLSEAVLNAREALKIHEQNVDAMNVLAEVFYRQGKYELVVSVTGTALAVDEKARTPKDSSVAYNLQGFAMASLGQDQMATKAFKKAAEADDKNAGAWNNLGARYLRAGDVKTAASCFQYAIDLRPNFANAQLNYGAVLRAQGKWEDAEKAFAKALKLRKGYAEAYFNLGVLYLDADPFPNLSTSQRLNKAILNLTKYKQLTLGDGHGTEPRPKKALTTQKLAPVSKDRADDYIRVAEKGIAREKRRLERENKRKTQPGEDPDSPTSADAGGGDGSEPAGTAPTKPGGAAPTKPGGAAPTKPGGAAPQKPGGAAPQKPGGAAPQKPGGAAPQKPGGAAPQKPGGAAPQKPGGAAPQKPPAEPKPSAPTTPTPKTPTPKQPGTQTPAPKKPGGSGPTPTPPGGPAPQKPGVQKPGGQKTASAWNPQRSWDTKIEGSAGTASAPRHPTWLGSPHLSRHSNAAQTRDADGSTDHLAPAAEPSGAYLT